MRVATSTFVQPGRWVTVLDSPLGQDNIIDLAVGLGEFRNDPNAALMTVADYQSAVRPGLIVHNRALGNPRRNGLYVGEHQLVGLHAEPELPAQHLQAEAALAQRGPEGALGFELHQDPGNLFDVKLKYVQDLRGDASGGLAHHDLHHPALLVHPGVQSAARSEL